MSTGSLKNTNKILFINHTYLKYMYEQYLTGPWSNELNVRQWSGRLGFNPRLSHTKNSKIVLDAALLNTQHYKVKIKGKFEQSRERSSVPSPTPQCSR